jgi:hypothetical protein
MRNIVVPHVTLLALVAVALAGVAQAQADPSSLLAGSGEFSGRETLLTFDDLGLANGDDVPGVAGVDLTLMDGNAAKFMFDGFPREVGPEGEGSVNNFWGYAFPYPDMTIRFSGVIHRLGFELRANDQDDVAVAFLASGSIVDEVTIESRGSDQLYFYGFENQAGFDEVLVDVVENASGAFTLDNLRFESLGLPEEGPPAVFCMGFISPLEALSQDPRHARYAGFWKHWLSWFPMTVLRAWLLDAEGRSVTDADLSLHAGRARGAVGRDRRVDPEGFLRLRPEGLLATGPQPTIHEEGRHLSRQHGVRRRVGVPDRSDLLGVADYEGAKAPLPALGA